MLTQEDFQHLFVLLFPFIQLLLQENQCVHKSLRNRHQLFKSHKKVEDTEEETIRNFLYCLLPFKGEGKKEWKDVGKGWGRRKRKHKERGGKTDNRQTVPASGPLSPLP